MDAAEIENIRMEIIRLKKQLDHLEEKCVNLCTKHTSDTKADSESDPKADSESDPKADSESDPKPDSESDSKTDSKPDSKPDSNHTPDDSDIQLLGKLPRQTLEARRAKYSTSAHDLFEYTTTA